MKINELFSYSTKELQDYLDTMDANGWRNIEEDDKVSVDKSLLKKIIGQAKRKLTLRVGGKDESKINDLVKKL